MTSASIGAWLERTSRRIAPFLAIAFTLALLLADTAYSTGRLLRLALDDRAQQLAAIHRWALGLRTPAPAPVIDRAVTLRVIQSLPAPCPAALPLVQPCRPAPTPSPAVAPPDLSLLTVAQLRTLARSRGHRGAKVRDARRGALLVMLA